MRLIQCKRFNANVGLDEIRAEVAKLFANVFTGVIPTRPDEVVFYISPDLTSPAARLLEHQSQWVDRAVKSLTIHLRRTPENDLVEFATEWWPKWDRANSLALTQRVKRFPDLLDEFFTTRKVIDASRADVKRDLADAVAPLHKKLDRLATGLLSGNAVDADPPTSGFVKSPAAGGLQLPAQNRESNFTGSKLADLRSTGSDTALASQKLAHLQLVNQLAASLNIPASTFLISTSGKPPPLPHGYMARPDVVESLGGRLFESPILTVIGYEESGKTIAIAEYVESTQAKCLWFTTPSSAHTGVGILFLYSLSQFLGVSSLAITDLGIALAHAKEPLLIVIDDAHDFSDASTLAFLLTHARSSAGNVRVVLAGTDSPAFVHSMRGQAIPDWRVPGMSSGQACTMFEKLGIEVTPTRKVAIEMLCSRCDGHVGMLRLALGMIEPVRDDTDLKRFMDTLPSSLGITADQFQASLIFKFRESLSDSCFQLSRRAAIALRPFQRRLIEAVWATDGPKSDFSHAWNQCVSGVFEGFADGRFEVPRLYQRGLKDFNTDSESARWHDAAADVLSNPVGNSFDLLDVCDSVVHRLLAGKHSKAIDQACAYLAIAAYRRDHETAALLLRQLELWLGRVVERRDVPRRSRVRWHSIRLRLCADVGLANEANTAAEKLTSLLESQSDDNDGDDTLAWNILLVHGSTTGRVSLATRAFKKTSWRSFIGDDRDHHNGRVFLLISAYLKAGENPLRAVHDLIRRPNEWALDAAELKYDTSDYELWRAAATQIYDVISQTVKGFVA